MTQNLKHEGHSKQSSLYKTQFEVGDTLKLVCTAFTPNVQTDQLNVENEDGEIVGHIFPNATVTVERLIVHEGPVRWRDDIQENDEAERLMGTNIKKF